MVEVEAEAEVVILVAEMNIYAAAVGAAASQPAIPETRVHVQNVSSSLPGLNIRICP